MCNFVIIKLCSNKQKHDFYLQLRETIFNFAQKELAPHAQNIDQTNEFK